MTDETQQTGAKAHAFEMWVPPVSPPKKEKGKTIPHLTITSVSSIFLSRASMKRLGMPERVNISVNPDAAEMIVWADDNGHLYVNRGKEKTTTGSIGATKLVRHFQLPTSSRWVSIDDAPGRILFRLEA